MAFGLCRVRPFKEGDEKRLEYITQNGIMSMASHGLSQVRQHLPWLASRLRGASFLCGATAQRSAWGATVARCVQGCLAHKTPPPPRTLQQGYAYGPMVVLGGGGGFL